MKDTEQRIKDIKEISIAIDNWDDIFSDFDPRPLTERALSEDFIAELKKRYRETRRGTFFVNIYVPSRLKDPVQEKAVIQRLKKHFKHRSMQRQRELNRIRRRGAFFVIFGVFCLGLLILITYFKWLNDLAIEIVSIALMPLGWFGVWEGFSKIVDTSPVFIQEEFLFSRLSKATFKFSHIEEDKAV